MVKRIDLDKIRQLRKSKGLSLDEMSKMIGYQSANGYYYLEIGRGRFPAETLARVADILGENINDLFYVQEIAKKENKDTA